jgi:hypothetical protein
VAALATVSGGLVAAAVAHAPMQKMVWMAAYLVLVVGVAQAALGASQALLAIRLPSARVLITECMLFNAGNAGVIAGTLLSSLSLLLAATLLFAFSLAMFLYTTRGAHGGWPIYAYRALLVTVAGGAIVGVALVATRAVH